MKCLLWLSFPGIVLLSSCSPSSSTTFTDTWKEPGATRLNFKKVLALVITNEDIIQRSAEKRLVENIRKAEAVPAHGFLVKDDLKDLEKVKAKVRERGIDGAIVLRVVAMDEEEQYVSGRYVTDPSYNFWGYYGYYWPRVYEPGYSVSQQVVIVESRIYSVTEDKLLWSGVSRTPDPGSVKNLIDDLAVAAVEQLRAEGLLE
jgi:hypothetical protein